MPIIKQGEMAMLDDGCWYWEQKCPGVLSANNLRSIADCLDDMNREWEEQMANDPLISTQ